MPFSEDLKIIPLTLVDFIKSYNVMLDVDIESNIQTYAIYLDTNQNQHHYGIYDNKRDWLIHQIVTYLKG